MRLKTTFAAVLFVYSLGLTVYAQEPAGPRPKRARTAEDYQPGTLKELAAKAASGERNKEETMVVDPDLSPTRVRATYAQLTARAPEPKAQLIREWARRYAGAPETYTRYEVDVAFTENGSTYWLTFTKKTVASFWDSGKWNKPVDLFLIKLGAIKQGDDWVPVLLVESFAGSSAKAAHHYVFISQQSETPLEDICGRVEDKKCISGGVLNGMIASVELRCITASPLERCKYGMKVFHRPAA